MGTVKKEILGSISGSVGTVVRSKWKGIQVIKIKPGPRSKRSKKNKPITSQQSKLTLMSQFLSRFKDIIQIGYAQQNNKSPAFSQAMKYNIAHAITGGPLNYEIDYAKIIISNGDRETAWSGQLYCEAGPFFRITWEIPETAKLKVIGKDKAHIILYNSTAKRILYPQQTAERKDLSVTVSVKPQFFVGDTFHAWLFFESPDGKSVSKSDYLGASVRL